MIITVLTLLLIFLCIVVVMLIMIQRTSGGMGSALGGGAADQVLGAGSAAQLTKMTVWCIFGFFILSFSLYALYQNEAGERATPIRAEDPEVKSDPDSSSPGDLGTPSPDLSDVPQAPPPAPSQDVAPAPPVEPADGQPQPIQQAPQAPLQLAPPVPEDNSSQ
ncbi:MAG: preprotein translocase subunit SecG [Opitutae bacterium]|jgi:protein translocase SecG subunit|nr:preprotein translocase subunit SecG [Opitutae bacterium]